MKTKLMRLYGDTMMSIGIWFMKCGENHATWVEFNGDKYEN
jgi:hypothetical protein